MAAPKRTGRTPKTRARKPPVWPAKFLEALEDTHMVTSAAKRAGVHRQRAYEHRASDRAFAEAWSEIEERSTELLEQVAVDRATEGSDVLLMFLLKARRPATYRENHRVELSGVDGAPIAAEITTVDAREHADATRDYLARLAGPDA